MAWISRRIAACAASSGAWNQTLRSSSSRGMSDHSKTAEVPLLRRKLLLEGLSRLIPVVEVPTVCHPSSGEFRLLARCSMVPQL